jgi:hypothetical protein
MSGLSPLSDDERAELIAYLDGELDEAASRTVEAKLASNPRIRAEAEELRKTWEMLDHLPQPEPSPQFTHRTVSLVSAARPALGGHARWRVWVGGLSWAAAVLLFGVGSYAAVMRYQPEEPSDENLVRDLRIIENKRYYEAADDIEFLHQLDDPDRFGEDSLGS